MGDPFWGTPRKAGFSLLPFGAQRGFMRDSRARECGHHHVVVTALVGRIKTAIGQEFHDRRVSDWGQGPIEEDIVNAGWLSLGCVAKRT